MKCKTLKEKVFEFISEHGTDSSFCFTNAMNPNDEMISLMLDARQSNVSAITQRLEGENKIKGDHFLGWCVPKTTKEVLGDLN